MRDIEDEGRNWEDAEDSHSVPSPWSAAESTTKPMNKQTQF